MKRVGRPEVRADSEAADQPPSGSKPALPYPVSGTRFPTMKDVSRCCGFSTATISRVLNDDPKVTSETRNRVLACMEQLGYRVNPIARSLKTSRTHTIGIIAPEFRNDFFMSVAEGIEDHLRERGYISFITNSREHAGQEASLVSMMIEKQVDGIIIIPAAGSGGEHYRRLRKIGLPFVLVDRLIDGFPADAVLTDNFRGAYDAVSICIREGARQIALIGGPADLTSAKERFAGYCSAMLDFQIKIDDSLTKFGDMHIPSGFRLMGELLAREPELSHVFIVNLFMRIGAEQYLAEHASGAAVKIAAFDESSISSLFTHTLVTVRQPLERIGAQAARLLLQRIDHEPLPFPQVLREQPIIVEHHPGAVSETS